MNKTIIISINASWNVINFRAGLVRALRSAGYRIVALTPTDPSTPRLAELGIEHVDIGVDNRGTSPLRDLGLFWRYYLLIGRIRPAAFLGYTIKPNIFGSLAANLHGVPVINNVAGLGETFLGRSWLNRLVRLLYRLALRRSRTVFFQNPDDRALFISEGIVKPDIAQSLPGSGVDLAHFVPRRGQSIPQDPTTFLLVSRLLWAKGISDYVEAARLVRRHLPQTRFQLLGLVQQGKGGIEQRVVADWVREGVIEFLGGDPDVRPFIAHADCIVLPTYYPEGTPRVLLEAAAMGKPIIASDVPGCREIVSDSNGFLCAPRDPSALAKLMITFIGLSRTEREHMGARSRERAERDFDERIVIDRYLEALARIDG